MCAWLPRLLFVSSRSQLVGIFLQSGRGDLRTIFQNEPKSAIEARKRDATRTLVYAADRGNSQSIYSYGIHDPSNQLPILIKPQWTRDTTAEQLVEEEEQAYRAWSEQLQSLQQERNLPCNLYERNIEVWRQLWRTIERSDVVVHLADARCPVLHLSDQVIHHIVASHPAKRVVIVLTKVDIVAADRVAAWKNFLVERYGDQIPVFPYNRELGDHVNAELLRLIGKVGRDINLAEREVVRQEDSATLTVGFVGEPNVGKSSLLNALFERKLVSVSATPGHTKHLQTHYFPHPELLGCSDAVQNVVVCDCPGVVFPRLNVPVALQILFGSFPIAQTREPFSAIRFIAENCDPPMEEVYKLKPVEEDDDGTVTVLVCEVAMARC
jgi:ribosome biogenesis GTPase A